MTRLIVISAPSGAGKTTLCQRLLAEFPELVLSISSTTRAPRGKELHGREYFFLAKEQFETQIADNRFAEWARVHDNYYGTSREVVEKTFAARKSLLLDIDVQGAESIRKVYPQNSDLIFIVPPSIEVLERRLRDRQTDSEASIQRRLANARGELSRRDLFDRVIVNDSLDVAYAELSEYVRKCLGASACSQKREG